MKPERRALRCPTQRLFSTFGANSGVAQGFANGAIYAATGGPRSGQAYFVTGLILARYNALGGAGRRLRHADQRRVRHGRRAPAEFRRRQHHVVARAMPRRRSIAAAKAPGLIVSPGSRFRGQPRAAGDRGLPREQHDPGLDHRPARFHGDHRQRRLQLGHVRPADPPRAAAWRSTRPIPKEPAPPTAP